MAKAYLVAVYYKIHDDEKLKNYGPALCHHHDGDDDDDDAMNEYE